jgi:hypothetical protein
LDGDMQSPEDQREAEQRGSTHTHPAQPHVQATPSPDASDWRVTSTSPDVLDWQEGSDLPPGYVKATRIRKGLVIAGAVTFGASWLATAAYGSYLINDRDPRYWERDNDEGARPEAVLYVPLVGPWIALGTVENDRRERAAFIAGGVVQAGGLAMLIAGVAAKQTVLVKTGDTEVGILPSVGGPNGTGAMLHGSF